MPAALPGKPMAVPPAGMPMTAQPDVMPGMAHAPGMMIQPGMPATSPVLVYDGGSAPTTTVTAGPNTARDADGAPAMLGGANPGRAFASDSSAARSTKAGEPASTLAMGTV